MPKRYNDDEDPNEQNWEPVILKKEPIYSKDKIELTLDQFIYKLREKREELKLSTIQLNTKCKFLYKYTIRDIESGQTLPTAFEIRTICSILNI